MCLDIDGALLGEGGWLVGWLVVCLVGWLVVWLVVWEAFSLGAITARILIVYISIDV